MDRGLETGLCSPVTHSQGLNPWLFQQRSSATSWSCEIPMNAKPERSASSKTLVVASTHGNKETDCVVNGEKVTVGVNAYIPVK